MDTLDFLDYVYGIFGFTFELELSTRPQARLGSEEQWDFAEEALDKLSFEQPVFLFSGCVLSHLTDEAVKNITTKISKITTSGSGLSLCENWGKEFHDYMWHVRTSDWWLNNLPGWNINFHGPNIEGKSDRFQGIHGIKK